MTINIRQKALPKIQSIRSYSRKSSLVIFVAMKTIYNTNMRQYACVRKERQMLTLGNDFSNVIEFLEREERGLSLPLPHFHFLRAYRPAAL